MKWFRVDGQQLGAAQTQTMPHPGECRHFGHATKLHSFKSHTTHEDPGFGGSSLRLLALLRQVTTLTRISGVYHGRGAGVYRHATRDHTCIYIYIYIYRDIAIDRI